MDTLPLMQIDLGRNHGLNVRATPRSRADIEALAEMLDRQKQYAPILVKAIKHKTFTHAAADGDSRIEAFRLNMKAGKIKGTFPVLVHVLGDDESAIEASIAAGWALPPHPVDQYEAFTGLHQGINGAPGLDAAQIASRFGLKGKAGELKVRRMMALGALAPEIRQLWREDKINPDVAEAFAVSADHKRQIEVYERLKKSHSLYSYKIKSELIGDQATARKLLKLVGMDAYKAAGGKLKDDLFADQNDSALVVENFPLLQKLATEKIKATCDKLLKDGWSWAAPASELPQNARYMWDDIGIKGKPTPEQMKKSGCIVDVSHDGKLEIVRGVKKNSDRYASGRRDPAPKKKKKTAGQPSAALALSLSEQLTRAVQQTVATDARATPAINIILAGLMTNKGSPAKIGANGFEASPTKFGSAKFSDNLEALDKMPPKKHAELIGRIAAATLDLRIPRQYDHDPIDKKAVQTLIEWCAGSQLTHDLIAAFDGKDYFERAGKAAALTALKECGYTDTAKIKNHKAGEIAKLATQVAKDKGWLPLELRPPNYKLGKPKK